MELIKNKFRGILELISMNVSHKYGMNDSI